jgi:hypothetical protein
MQLSIDLAGVTLSSAEIMQGVSGKHQQMSSVLLQKFRKVLGDKMIEKYKVFKAEHEMLEEVNVARSMEGALKLLGEKARLNDLWDGWRADLEVLTEAEGLLTGRQQRSLGGDWLYAQRVQSEFDMLVAVFNAEGGGGRGPPRVAAGPRRRERQVALREHRAARTRLPQLGRGGGPRTRAEGVRGCRQVQRAGAEAAHRREDVQRRIAGAPACTRTSRTR